MGGVAVESTAKIPSLVPLGPLDTITPILPLMTHSMHGFIGGVPGEAWLEGLNSASGTAASDLSGNVNASKAAAAAAAAAVVGGKGKGKEVVEAVSSLMAKAKGGKGVGAVVSSKSATVTTTPTSAPAAGSTPSTGGSATASVSGNVYVAIRKYRAQSDIEVSLDLGDEVEILSWDDGAEDDTASTSPLGSSSDLSGDASGGVKGFGRLLKNGTEGLFYKKHVILLDRPASQVPTPAPAPTPATTSAVSESGKEEAESGKNTSNTSTSTTTAATSKIQNAKDEQGDRDDETASKSLDKTFMMKEMIAAASGVGSGVDAPFLVDYFEKVGGKGAKSHRRKASKPGVPALTNGGVPGGVAAVLSKQQGQQQEDLFLSSLLSFMEKVSPDNTKESSLQVEGGDKKAALLGAAAMAFGGVQNATTVYRMYMETLNELKVEAEEAAMPMEK
ncbi:hypothetical protein HK102_010395, partial [Quaeritorhiza haematococci]